MVLPSRLTERLSPPEFVTAFGDGSSLFFIVYIFLSSFMILNLFIGVITNSITDAKTEVRPALVS